MGLQSCKYSLWFKTGSSVETLFQETLEQYARNGWELVTFQYYDAKFMLVLKKLILVFF